MPSPYTYPDIIHVEPTTRCNMRCRMCVKSVMTNAQEGDLPLKAFKRLETSLPRASRVVFAGVGEPLLHPDLPEMVAFARRHLPEGGGISMQTNGLLLSPETAERLVEAGLDTVCVSIDSLDAADGESLHGAARAGSVAGAFEAVREASRKTGRTVRLGAEIVLMRQNAGALPDLVRFAGERGAGFVIVSHVFSYNSEAERESLFNPNPEQATGYFEKWKAIAASEGLSFDDYYAILWKVGKSPQQKRLVELVKLMQRDANQGGVWMNVKSLFEWGAKDQGPLRDAYDRARAVASGFGMELSLPPLAALHERRCGFMEDGAAFVSWRGEVSPCHFLWRDYRCVMDGEPKRVCALSFGNISDAPLEEIWRKTEYRQFREQALAYEYPYCSSCNGGPCSDITAHGSPFEEDCIGSKVPCCHCPWPVGQLACLS
ncbi:MAG: radical SAM/SPASM family putative metalloenzyme maturase [Thermodesulfobacteriota bacterium]